MTVEKYGKRYCKQVIKVSVGCDKSACYLVPVKRSDEKDTPPVQLQSITRKHHTGPNCGRFLQNIWPGLIKIIKVRKKQGKPEKVSQIRDMMTDVMWNSELDPRTGRKKTLLENLVILNQVRNFVSSIVLVFISQFPQRYHHNVRC